MTLEDELADLRRQKETIVLAILDKRTEIEKRDYSEAVSIGHPMLGKQVYRRTLGGSNQSGTVVIADVTFHSKIAFYGKSGDVAVLSPSGKSAWLYTDKGRDAWHEVLS